MTIRSEELKTAILKEGFLLEQKTELILKKFKFKTYLNKYIKYCSRNYYYKYYELPVFKQRVDMK